MSFEVKVKLEGEKEVIAKLKKLKKAYPEATAAALYQEGFGIGALAQDKAPLDEGLLEKSMYVAPPTLDDDEPTVEIGFGTQYAVIQHERTDFHHPKKGEAKYLEKAAYERAAGMLRRLAKRIVELASKGIGVKAIPPQAPTSPPGGLL